MVDHNEVRSYYDNVYYKGLGGGNEASPHLCRLAACIGLLKGRELLDVGCGGGYWLMAAAARGAKPVGIDISEAAIEFCRGHLPQAELQCGPAETLPFGNNRFDVVTCLGSLEHFLDPEAALREMVRVAKPRATFLLLVPNADFLPRRLGLYGGTEQASVHEEVHTLVEWEGLFNSVGLNVMKRWRDLHILTWSWVVRGKWYLWPFRAAQALMLPLWPISWQYQVYYLCQIR